MSRHFPDWLSAYCDFAGYTEAPRRMHFWAGVSAIAGALRRRVFFDQFYFKWIPNFYIIFVAPPGVVAKSTTADVALNLLREVPGIHFGPDIVTWQALVSSFTQASEMYIDQSTGEYLAEAAITCSASELGNLLDPRDRSLVDLLVTLWDNRKNLDKTTKLSGSDHITNPSTNIIGCTTPSWLQENVPAGVVGGGFTSRCIFVYADQKAKLVDLPGFDIPQGQSLVADRLVEDLIEISQMQGGFSISPDGRRWSKAWYEKVWGQYNAQEEVFGNYVARKQTHLFKLAMVISIAQRSDLLLTAEDLSLANAMLEDTEVDMPKVFARMGKSNDSIQVDRFVSYINRRGSCSYEDAYRFVHAFFPDLHDFEGIVSGVIRAGLVKMEQRGGELLFVARDTLR